MVRLGAELSRLQKFQGVLGTPEEVSTRREILHRMHDQVKIIKLPSGRFKEVGWKTSSGTIENDGKLCQRDGCCFVEASRRTTAQDHLFDRVLRLYFFRQ